MIQLCAIYFKPVFPVCTCLKEKGFNSLTVCSLEGIIYDFFKKATLSSPAYFERI